jgi:hypothetical protein
MNVASHATISPLIAPASLSLPTMVFHYPFKPFRAYALSETRKLGRMIGLLIILNVA